MKGQKEIPVGKDNCLYGLSFLFTGVLDSIEREEAEQLVTTYGGSLSFLFLSFSLFLIISGVGDQQKGRQVRDKGAQLCGCGKGSRNVQDPKAGKVECQDDQRRPTV